MKKGLRIFLILAIMTSIFVCANVIGYAIWDLNQPPVEKEIPIDHNTDEFAELTGVSIVNNKQLKMGVFFFEEDDSNTAIGNLGFTITLDRNNLPSDIKNSAFILETRLTTTNEHEETIFKPDTIEKVEVEIDTTITQLEENVLSKNIVAYINVGASDTVIHLNYYFKQKLVTDFGDLLKNETFTLRATYSKDGN